MRVHWLRHIHYEGLGSIEPWLKSRSAQVSVTELYQETRLPDVSEFDWLIIMGGPMSANDDCQHPWLIPERGLISQAIASGKVVLGICLGAQLIARSQGARVYASHEPEVGWFEIERLASEPAYSPLSGVADPMEVFHWHGETFDLPPGASKLARSRGCENQAFLLGPKVLGLQFHLEMNLEGAGALIKNSLLHTESGRFIQSSAEILAEKGRFAAINDAMATVLANLEKAAG